MIIQSHKTSIRSSFKFFKVYVLPTLGSIFFFGVAYFTLFEFQPLPGKPVFVLRLVGFGSFLMGVSTIYMYVKQLPVINITDTGIELKSWLGHTYVSWFDVKKVKLTGKAPFKFLIGFPMEAVTITLQNDKKINLFDEHYVNGHLIKQYIKSYGRLKIAPVLIETTKIDPVALEYEKFEVFKGNVWFSLRGIMLFSLYAMMIFLLVSQLVNGKEVSDKAVLPVLLICILWYLFNGYFCHYVKVSNKYIVIQNAFLPWIRKAYLLSEIEEIVIESQPKWPNCIRIITSSYESKLFPSGTLRDTDWHALMKKIRANKIRVRNECI